ncbi:uncharacterized protein DS421_17g578330 [Arachis hypogaea]|nr:uncharacterized protein DS421_17g578330 [Arachis hypogaea]
MFSQIPETRSRSRTGELLPSVLQRRRPGMTLPLLPRLSLLWFCFPNDDRGDGSAARQRQQRVERSEPSAAAMRSTSGAAAALILLGSLGFQARISPLSSGLDGHDNPTMEVTGRRRSLDGDACDGCSRAC